MTLQNALKVDFLFFLPFCCTSDDNRYNRQKWYPSSTWLKCTVSHAPLLYPTKAGGVNVFVSQVHLLLADCSLLLLYVVPTCSGICSWVPYRISWSGCTSPGSSSLVSPVPQARVSERPTISSSRPVPHPSSPASVLFHVPHDAQWSWLSPPVWTWCPESLVLWKVETQRIVANYNDNYMKLLLVVNNWASFLLISWSFATWKNWAKAAEWNVGPMTLDNKRIYANKWNETPSWEAFSHEQRKRGKSDALTKILVHENWYVSHPNFCSCIVDLYD